ncbi:hypothetical protein PXD56_18585 [Maribacter sp. SA7]|uniref:hypothetical protein n=1 Tax=Maribacter zhoushanensis TaxID=3030012 RepID=UPI0023ED9F5A|nr:hypothetical protein [Maribacter zhoushanensis]MDF4204977.1 hypothetical protein [Maribacter zhoushanensis]
MKYFENRVTEYKEYYEQIRRDTVNSSACRISSAEIDEIDEIYSLYLLYENNLLGALKEEFDNKLQKLNTRLTKDQIFTVLKNLDI